MAISLFGCRKTAHFTLKKQKKKRKTKRFNSDARHRVPPFTDQLFKYLFVFSSVARGGGGGAIAPSLACRPKCKLGKTLRF